jgi:hypothetical protein
MQKEQEKPGGEFAKFLKVSSSSRFLRRELRGADAHLLHAIRRIKNLPGGFLGSIPSS